MKRQGIKRKPSMIDYYIYALAKEKEAKIVTRDKHFKGLNNVIYKGN